MAALLCFAPSPLLLGQVISSGGNSLDPLPAELAGFAKDSVLIDPGAEAAPPLVVLPEEVDAAVRDAEAWVVALEQDAAGVVPPRDAQIKILPALVAGAGDAPAETPLQKGLLARTVPLLKAQENEHWGDVDHSFGVSLMQVGLYRDAEFHLMRCLRLRGEHLGKDHVLTRSTVFALLRLYQRWGKPDVADHFRVKSNTAQ